MSKSYFKTAALISFKLLLICAVIAGVVSFVYSVTIDAYNQNLENEKRIALAGIFAESDDDIIDYETLLNTPEGVNDVYVVGKNYEKVGYCVNVTAKGFGGDMTLMIGYDFDGKIKGVDIISHAETPGVGTKAMEASHLSQYSGKSGELTISKSASSDIVAVSGATISSKAINAAVNTANGAIAYLKALENGQMPNEGGIE